MKATTFTQDILHFYYSSVWLIPWFSPLQWWLQSAGFRALPVSISQCLHLLSSKALQISWVLASTKLNMHIFNPFMCSTFIGEAAHYYFVTNIHSHSTKSNVHYRKWQSKWNYVEIVQFSLANLNLKRQQARKYSSSLLNFSINSNACFSLSKSLCLTPMRQAREEKYQPKKTSLLVDRGVHSKWK